MNVPDGSTFAFIGANGAGKTTTIKTLMNIIEPDRGSVLIAGVESRRLRAIDYAKIGYVSENQKLPDGLTVGQFLAYLRRFYPTWDRRLENRILDQAQLPLTRRIRALSHGMRAKLALISALSFRPKLLVLDEPFTGLDPLVRDEFMEILLGQRSDTTLLISSHELSEIDGVATHIGFVDKGRLLFQESMADLAARVREVHVTLEREPTAPQFPPEWLNVKVAGDALSFVDIHFDETLLRARIAAVLGAVRNVEFRPVELRSIFTTIARTVRKEAA
jgi:ABC-2 type transport system ATP-binding protein